ncbi:hypothetical protein BaRGS_00033244 [Batillaria attramentaria]|uniref:Uncharacterized protein n=1 Tax=Batillaria attramentaria TaxID=370345 RepID=A0ABD0JL27_9CAEN
MVGEARISQSRKLFHSFQGKSLFPAAKAVRCLAGFDAGGLTSMNNFSSPALHQLSQEHVRESIVCYRCTGKFILSGLWTSWPGVLWRGWRWGCEPD